MPKGRRAKRYRIAIQGFTETKGNYGQPVRVWSDVPTMASIAADYNVTGGTETFRGQQVQAEVVAVFAIREQPTEITTEHRLVHEGKTYGIVAVRPSDGPFENGHRDTLIFVKALANG